MLNSQKTGSSREKMLRAATALFAAKGFHGTSTREVAKRARVNEITIYRLFKNKRELYLQVLNNAVALVGPDWLHPLLQADNSEDVFITLALRLEKIFNPTFLRLLFYAALEQPELLRKCYRPRLANFYEILGKHIQERIDTGMLRNVEPGLMGCSLVGMIAYHQILCELLGGRDFPGCSNASSAEAYADIWSRGAFAYAYASDKAASKQSETISSKVRQHAPVQKPVLLRSYKTPPPAAIPLTQKRSRLQSLFAKRTICGAEFHQQGI